MQPDASLPLAAFLQNCQSKVSNAFRVLFSCLSFFCYVLVSAPRKACAVETCLNGLSEVEAGALEVCGLVFALQSDSENSVQSVAWQKEIRKLSRHGDPSLLSLIVVLR